MVAIFQKYMGTGLISILFLAALVYLLIKEKDRPKRILFIYCPIIVLLLFFNPLFFGIFAYAAEEEIYFRLMWLLPVAVVIAYAAVSIFDLLKGKARIGFGVTAVLVICVSGKLVYSSPLYSVAENLYHVPQKVVDICDAIKIEGREVMAAFPDEFLLYVRQYSPVVCMPYGRESITGSYDEFNALMDQKEIQVDELVYLSRENLCHYVILSEDKCLLGDMEAYGFRVFDKMHGYVIYMDTTMNFGLD